MKTFPKTIALILLSLIIFSTLCSCGIFMPSVPNNNPSGNNDTQKPGDPGTIGGDDNNNDSTNNTTEFPNEDDKSILYGFMPTISEVMPVIHINTENSSNSWATSYNRNDKLTGRIDYVDATISVDSCDEEYKLKNVEAEVKVRGNYTLDYSKKPIRIKFGKKNNLLGLNDGQKFKSWVLLADWKDLSMTNNTLAFYLGQNILGSDGYYCTDFRNVEVYLNGKYWGVYLLVEQQEVKEGRTSVPEVEKNYTGNDIGYFFEYDGYYHLEDASQGGDPTFEMNYSGIDAQQKGYSVKSDIYADSQLEFLKNYMNNLYYIMYQAIFNNKYYKFNSDYTGIQLAPEYDNARDTISAVVDLQSLVDTYILDELVCNADVDSSSFYLSVDMTEDGNKKLTFEAPWDFDSCFGIRYGYVNDAQGMYALNSDNPWYKIFKNCDWFTEMVREKWSEIKEYEVIDKAFELISMQKTVYHQYYVKNYQRWSERLNGNFELISLLNSYNDANTAQGLASDYLTDWFTKRVAYLDSKWTVSNTPNIPNSSSEFLFEAENATLSGFASDTPIRTERSYASGGAYVGDIAKGSTITFTVMSEGASYVNLCIGVSKLSYEFNFGNYFKLEVNGNEIEIPINIVPAISDGEDDWHTFITIPLTNINLKKGQNKISFIALNNATNIDYIIIYSEKGLS